MTQSAPPELVLVAPSLVAPPAEHVEVTFRSVVRMIASLLLRLASGAVCSTRVGKAQNNVQFLLAHDAEGLVAMTSSDSLRGRGSGPTWRVVILKELRWLQGRTLAPGTNATSVNFRIRTSDSSATARAPQRFFRETRTIL